MSTNNPYEFKSTLPFGVPALGSQGEELDRSIKALVETRPWARLLGVIAASWAVLYGLRCLFAAPEVLRRLTGRLHGEPVGFDGVQIFAGVMTVCASVMLCMATVYLFRYGSAISRAENSQSPDDVAKALVLQRKIVKLIAIGAVVVTVVLLVIYILMQITNGVDWLFSEPVNDLAKIVMWLSV